MPKGDIDCVTCGECCKKLTVKLSSCDIRKIGKKGYEPCNFTVYDSHINAFTLKRNRRGCVFLGRNKGKYSCKIYDVRPKVCQKYPAFKTPECRPAMWRASFKKNP